jgi:hypothetical protein
MVKPLLDTCRIVERASLGNLLNRQELKGEGVEIGTHRGDFAKAFMDRWEGRQLHCIDPWSIPPGYEHQATFLPDQGSDREADYQHCQNVLRVHASRITYHRTLSSIAAETFELQSRIQFLDFVYLDGDHDYAPFCQDLLLWYPLIKPGGILAGHDFLCPGEPDGSWGRFIQPALINFCSERNLTIHMIQEYNQPWSWYIFKPNPGA